MEKVLNGLYTNESREEAVKMATDGGFEHRRKEQQLLDRKMKTPIHP